MQRFFDRADDILRNQFRLSEPPPTRTVLWQFLKCICFCGLAYGAVMGSFSGILGDRFWQVLYSSAKVPFLLLGTFVICLPSFFVLNTLFGVRADFTRALGALAASQATLTVVLCSLAPLTVVWYLSAVNYSAAILFNGLMFAIASLTAQVILHRLYGPLILHNTKHRLLLRLWLGLYIFVGIQLGWLLRPFIGQPGLPVQMFRDEAWGNAYINLLQHVWDLLGR